MDIYELRERNEQLEEDIEEYRDVIGHAIQQLEHSKCPYAIAELEWLKLSLVEK